MMIPYIFIVIVVVINLARKKLIHRHENTCELDYEATSDSDRDPEET